MLSGAFFGKECYGIIKTCNGMVNIEKLTYKLNLSAVDYMTLVDFIADSEDA